MILKANQKYIDMSCVRHLLANGEKNVDFLTFEVSKNYHEIDISECTFILRAVNSVGNLIEQTLKKQIQNDSIFLTWTVDEYFTAVSGGLKLEIRGVKGDELVIKYDLSDIIVRESAVGEGPPEIPDVTVIQGEKGDDGLSAYEIWLSLGNSGTETDFIESLKGEKGSKGSQGKKGDKGDTGEQGIQGEKGDDGLSAYEVWLSLGNSGTEADFVESLKGEQGVQGIQGEKGEIGLTGNTGENGKDGVDGHDGKSAYETWLSLGNSGTESDFITSLKGEKGDDGERGLQGIQGEKGADGIDGISPVIEVCEDTETSYRLLITDKLNSFKTPNLKGLNGVSDSEISDLKNQISNLNNLVSSLQTGGGNLKITTLFDSSDYEKYKSLWSFKCSQWDDRAFSFDEVTVKNTAFCNEENGYTMRFSNSFGWSADVTAMCSESVEINDRSILIVDYNCSSDGNGMTAEIIPDPDFTSQKTAEFEMIPAFYAINTYLSSNFRLVSILDNNSYYLRLKVNTTNPTFTIRKILMISG
ncbi:MAG: hypothetical protein NC177_05740 [Ruminococcus flavefaciens]|nr:hypothetical protein [Ruminococcus flavefaciens]